MIWDQHEGVELYVYKTQDLEGIFKIQCIIHALFSTNEHFL